MKKLDLSIMEVIDGGGKAEFCKGFGVVAFGYEAGVLANFWNPIGWGGQAALLAVGGYCLL